MMGLRVSDTFVSRETKEALRRFAEMVLKWNTRINITRVNDFQNLWRRHVLDSVGLAKLVSESTGVHADLGSGGGFPGVVCAIYNPASSLHLVECDRRKAAFLRAVRRELDLSYRVVEDRIESAEPLGANIVSARALASLPDLLGFMERHISSDGRALFMKGRTWRTEIEAARQKWDFRYIAHSSYTATDSVILEIEQLERRFHDG